MFKSGIKNRKEKMNWYLASLQLHTPPNLSSGYRLRRYHYLVEAGDHEEGYRRSIELGNRLATESRVFAGLDDLLLISDPPKDGSELTWSQIELTPKELATEVRPKEQLRAFVERQPSSSGWYVGSVVLCEIHDAGSHGERLLIWINSYLIVAKGAKAAYERIMQIGRELQDNAGSHFCDGDKAHWEFKGIRDIVPVHERPTDGSLLWCDDISATTGDLKNTPPEK